MKMSLRMQTALGIYAASVTVGSLLCWHLYATISTEYRQDFILRHEAVAATIASTFGALEQAADKHADDALRTLYEADAMRGPLSGDELVALRDATGVAEIYVYGQEGEFIGWTRQPADLQFNAFDICSEYGGFFTGEKRQEISPFVPALPAPPAPPPTKFAKRVSSDGKRLLQVVLYSHYVSDALAETQENYKDITGSGIFAPNGQSLGPVASAAHDQEEVLQLLNGSGPPVLGRSLISVKHAASQQECCQCLQKGLVRNGKSYEYDLRFVLSEDSLNRALAAWAWRLSTALGCVAVAAIFAALALASYLVKKLDHIRGAARKIAGSGDYSMRIPEENG